MPSSLDKSPTRPTPTVRASAAETGRHPGVASGRVRFDERGNAKWEMRTAAQTFVAEGSTTLVRKLVPPLSLEPTVRVPKLSVPTAATARKPLPPPEPRLARPERAPTRAEMGTVRTFPVPRSQAQRTGKAKPVRKPDPRPVGLLRRLFGRKS